MGVQMFGNRPDLHLLGWINMRFDRKLCLVCNGVCCVQRRRRILAGNVRHAHECASLRVYLCLYAYLSTSRQTLCQTHISKWNICKYLTDLHSIDIKIPYYPLIKMNTRRCWWSRAQSEPFCVIRTSSNVSITVCKTEAAPVMIPQCPKRKMPRDASATVECDLMRVKV